MVPLASARDEATEQERAEFARQQQLEQEAVAQGGQEQEPQAVEVAEEEQQQEEEIQEDPAPEAEEEEEVTAQEEQEPGAVEVTEEQQPEKTVEKSEQPAKMLLFINSTGSTSGKNNSALPQQLLSDAESKEKQEAGDTTLDDTEALIAEINALSDSKVALPSLYKQKIQPRVKKIKDRWRPAVGSLANQEGSPVLRLLMIESGTYDYAERMKELNGSYPTDLTILSRDIAQQIADGIAAVSKNSAKNPTIKKQ